MADTGYDTDFSALESLGAEDLFSLDRVSLDADPSIVTTETQLARALVKGIEFTLELEEITHNISFQLTQTEFRQLSNALKKTTKLKVLNLCGQTKLDQGMKLLQEALLVNKSLQELNLCSCEVDPEICKSISEILKTNKTLRIIDIQWNYNTMCAECYKYIAEGLLANNTLIEMNMGENPLNDEGLSYLKPVAELNKTLRLFNIDDSNVDNTEWRYVINKLRENYQNQQTFTKDTMVVIHNIARDSSARQKLPIEIWCHVLTFMKHPGVFIDFGVRAKAVFDKYGTADK